MDTPPPPPPSTIDPPPVVQHVADAQAKSADTLWGRPIFRAPELKSFSPRKKEGYFPQKPFKGRVRDKRIG